MKSIILLLCILISLCSCRNTSHKKIEHIVKEWYGKTILFPKDMYLISHKDTTGTVNFNKIHAPFTILHYIDTLGCMSCKLHLQHWKTFLTEVDSISQKGVNCLMIFYPQRKKNLLRLLQLNEFDNYVYIDQKDSCNKLNGFPIDEHFCTFLLDKDLKVLAYGNPIHNHRIRKLYLNLIQDKFEKTYLEGMEETEVAVNVTSLSLGSFPWQEEQKTLFTLKNVGEHSLIIEGTTTSCDCTTVSYSKEPVAPGNEVKLEVVYKAEKPEPFYRTISVYCNTSDAPIELEITGEAK